MESPKKVADIHDKNLRNQRREDSCSNSTSTSKLLNRQNWRSGVNMPCSRAAVEKSSRASPEKVPSSKSLQTHNDRNKIGKKRQNSNREQKKLPAGNKSISKHSSDIAEEKCNNQEAICCNSDSIGNEGNNNSLWHSWLYLHITTFFEVLLILFFFYVNEIYPSKIWFFYIAFTMIQSVSKIYGKKQFQSFVKKVFISTAKQMILNN